MIDAAAHYAARVGQFAAQAVEPGAILLLGSSHLEWFDAPALLPGRRFVNRGIASDRLGIGERGILRRLDVSVWQVQPGFIVFENGANDLGELWRHGAPSAEEIVAAYEQVVATLRARRPHTPLLIVNVLPTTGRFAGLNPYIADFNPHVRRIAAAHGCEHLDAHALLVDARGELAEGLTDDGLHLNEIGYRRFADALAPLLPPACPPAPHP